MLELRRSIPESERSRRGVIVAERLKAMAEFKRSKVVALFYPIRGEVDLLSTLKKEEKLFCLPKVKGKRLLFGRVEQRLVEGSFGIPEPEVADVDFEDIDLFAVPALAYDFDCFRLGYGGGYYDRLIKGRLPHQVFIGVAYDFQLVDSIGPEPWDAPVDVVLTESNIIYRATATKLRGR